MTEEYKMAKEILEKTVLEDWELMYLVEVNHSDKQIKQTCDSSDVTCNKVHLLVTLFNSIYYLCEKI